MMGFRGRKFLQRSMARNARPDRLGVAGPLPSPSPQGGDRVPSELAGEQRQCPSEEETGHGGS